MTHRINRCDRETVSHRGVRSAAPTLAKNSFLLREVHRVPHHEKESGEAKIADDLQLVLELRPLLLVDLAPALTSALEDFLAQESVVVVTGGNGKLRQRRPHPGKIEITFSRDALTLPQSCFATLPALRHFFRRGQTPLAIGMQQPARNCIVDSGVVTQRCQNVMN